MKKLLMSFLTVLFVASANAQLINAGFETWEGPGTGTYPTGWKWVPGTMQWTRTNDAHSGIAALEVSVWYYYTDTKAEQWATINYRPTALVGWYKYTENIIKNVTTNLITDDTAFAKVYLTKWNSTAAISDTIGIGEIALLGSPDYRHFSCPIIYRSSAIPDTVVVCMDPSMMRNGGSYFSTDSTGLSSRLKIDDLYLQGSPAALSVVTNSDIKVWPNPAIGKLNVFVDVANCKADIYDLSGHTVLTQTMSKGNNQIEINRLPSGVFILTISDNLSNRIFSQQIIHG